MALAAVPVTLLMDSTGRCGRVSDSGERAVRAVSHVTGEGASPSKRGRTDGSCTGCLARRQEPAPWVLPRPACSTEFRNRLRTRSSTTSASTSLLDRCAPLGQERMSAKRSKRQRDIDALIRELRSHARTWPGRTSVSRSRWSGSTPTCASRFADRGAVVRQGGGRRNRSALVPLAGDDVLWRARVAQLVEHLASASTACLRRRCRSWSWPRSSTGCPGGILPKNMIDVVARRQLVSRTISTSRRSRCRSTSWTR